MEKLLNDDAELETFLKRVQVSLLNSFLENSEYNASSTNSRKIKELIESFNII